MSPTGGLSGDSKAKSGFINSKDWELYCFKCCLLVVQPESNRATPPPPHLDTATTFLTVLFGETSIQLHSHHPPLHPLSTCRICNLNWICITSDKSYSIGSIRKAAPRQELPLLTLAALKVYVTCISVHRITAGSLYCIWRTDLGVNHRNNSVV